MYQNSIVVMGLLFSISCSNINTSYHSDNASLDPDPSLVIEENINLQTFIVLKYHSIANDLIRGDGMYIRALTQAAGISGENFGMEVDNIRRLLKQSDGIFEFSEIVTAHYLSK